MVLGEFRLAVYADRRPEGIESTPEGGAAECDQCILEPVGGRPDEPQQQVGVGRWPLTV